LLWLLKCFRAHIDIGGPIKVGVAVVVAHLFRFQGSYFTRRQCPARYKYGASVSCIYEHDSSRGMQSHEVCRGSTSVLCVGALAVDHLCRYGHVRPSFRWSSLVSETSSQAYSIYRYMSYYVCRSADTSLYVLFGTRTARCLYRSVCFRSPITPILFFLQCET